MEVECGKNKDLASKIRRKNQEKQRRKKVLAGNWCLTGNQSVQ